MSWSNPYIIYDTRDGREICQCAHIEDAMLMISFDPDHRKYRQRQIIMDQIVDVKSEKLPDDLQLKEQRILPDRQAVPVQV